MREKRKIIAKGWCSSDLIEYPGVLIAVQFSATLFQAHVSDLSTEEVKERDWVVMAAVNIAYILETVVQWLCLGGSVARVPV